MAKKYREHPNKYFYLTHTSGNLRNIAGFRKSHRRPVPDDVQKLAEDINWHRKQLCYNSINNVNNIIRSLGYKIGDHVAEFFLDEEFGVGFNPKPETRKKLEHLLQFLKDEYKSLTGNVD